jgi:hypothetical protein
MDLTLPLAGIGLPQADEYIAFDFWNNTLLKPFKETLAISIPGASCGILAARPLLPHPFLISTSRHVTQGIVDVKKEIWEPQTKVLTGISALVADDHYELRVVARGPDADPSSVRCEVSAADVAAGVTITGTVTDGLLRAVIKSPVSRSVAWSLRFGPGR